MMTLGEFIKTKRKECGMSISQLSQVSNVSQPFISQIEAGNRNPSYSKMKDIANALGIDYKVLLDLSEGVSVDILSDEPSEVIPKIDIVKFFNQRDLLFKGEQITDEQKEKILKMIEIIIN